MRITFGLALDGSRARRSCNRLGEPVLGPAGMLGLLEMQLGLFPNSVSQSERIVQYRACLKRCDSPARFYHRSFDIDEFGTAATLLGWRDRWHLNGWGGAAIPDGGVRLDDMAEVEAKTLTTVAPSTGQRLALVAEALRMRRTGIESIRLRDSLEALPKRWRDVLQALPLVAASETPISVGDGFLGELQSALLPALSGGKPSPIRWRDDGTVTIAQAETRLLAGPWLAASLELPADQTLLVAERHGLLLDEALACSDQPRQGFRELSAFRPTLQVLPLALALVWDPLDVGALLQFLTHPVCPLHFVARNRLAEKIAATPGLGGKNWEEAVGRIAEYYGERAADVRQQITSWVEHPRYDRAAGAPLVALIARAGAVRDFFRVRLAEDEPVQRAANSAGHSQAFAMVAALEALAAQGDERIRPRQLEQLLAQATARGSDNPLLEAQAGAGPLAQEPAAVIEPADTVIWWQLDAPVLPGSYPWSKSELAALASSGVDLPPVAKELAFRAQAWLRPILAARRHLVLVLPPEGQEVHPLWLMLRALAKGSTIPVRRLETLLTEPAGKASLTEVEHRPPPVRRRWWRLPDGTAIVPSQYASYSSLNLYLNNPYQWVLQYPARLRTSTILTAPDNFTLFGNLAHRLVERWYRQPEALARSDAELREWFEATFDEAIGQDGATLLMPGKRAYLEGFRRQLRESLEQLHAHLRAANPQELTPEASLKGNFVGGPIIGSSDLLIRDGDGRPAVVDMKWAGARKYRDALRDGQILQLVVYSECVRQATGSWPRIAYYILNEAQMLTLDEGLFPGARVAWSKAPKTTAELWQQFLISWTWRREQLNAGCIELVFDDVEPTDESQPPEGALPVRTLGTRYDPFVNLAGWGC